MVDRQVSTAGDSSPPGWNGSTDSADGVRRSDSELIAASLDDGERFAEVFERHWPQVRRYVARRLGVDVADDVAAEVFVTAFRIRGRYDLRRPDAPPWLYGIASRLISQHRRTEERQLRLLRHAERDAVEARFEDLSDSRVEARLLRPRLLELLAQLKPADRDLLLLVAWGELTYEQAAEALGLRVGTVRSRLSRLRRRAQAALRLSLRRDE